jgi:tRNA G46 methylase TrmB
LDETVLRHAFHPWKKPVAEHSLEAFRGLEAQVNRWSGPLVLDSGCGTGQSTRLLAIEHPDSLVLGIDKSVNRLGKHVTLPEFDQENYLLCRMDLPDLWLLARQAGWRFSLQTFFYPNPWPKPEHRLRRWPFHPVFPVVLETGGRWELRTNWDIYAHEMARAFALLTGVEAPVHDWNPAEPQTLFERKYQESGQTLSRWTASVPTTWRAWEEAEAR